MANLYFFNFKAHNGDLHYYREFIKDIINKLNYDEYYLLQNTSEKLLSDINKLKFDKLNDNCFINETIYNINNDIYINIHGSQLEDRQILNRNEHLSIFKGALNLDYYHYVFSIIYTKLNILISGIESYIPDIDYSKFEIENINTFINSNQRHKILICNGECHTFQSGKIDFLSIIDKLSENNKDLDFILTHKINLIKENILFTDDIINAKFPDLNEISYLSTFCDIIIGRASGPYCFTITKENIKNTNKTYIFITSSYLDGIYTDFNACDKLWINNFDDELIYNLIDNKIKKKISILKSKNSIKNIHITKSENRFDFSAPDDAENIRINSYVDNNGDGNFTIAYGTFFNFIAKDANYFIIISRFFTEKTKFKIQFLYFQELIYETIL